MTDSTTVLSLAFDTGLNKMSLCSYDFLGDTFSCFVSPDTFFIQTYDLTASWIGTEVAIGGIIPYKFG